MTKYGYSHKMSGDIVEHFTDLLGLKTNNSRIGFVLYWLFRSSLSNTWLRLPRNESFYNDSSKTNGISYKLMIEKIIDPLTDLGYLETIPGNHFSEIQTLIKPSVLFDQIFSTSDFILVEDAVIHVKGYNPIVVRNPNKKPISFSTSNREFRRMLKNVNIINAKIASSSITFIQEEEGKGGTYNGSYTTNTEYPHCLSEFAANQKVSFTNSAKHLFHLYRIFNKRGGKGKEALFNLGGRFYASGQNMPKSERKNICINGERTTELDFSNLHPRMLAAKEGIEFPAKHDTYTGEKMLEIDPNRENNKELVNALLSCATPPQMMSMLHGKGFKEQAAQAYIEAVLEHNPWLSNHIGKDVGVLLQNVDAKMTEKIMLRFIKQTSSAILPVHDSYIVQEKHEEILRKIMLDVWDEQYPDVSMEIG